MVAAVTKKHCCKASFPSSLSFQRMSKNYLNDGLFLKKISPKGSKGQDGFLTAKAEAKEEYTHAIKCSRKNLRDQFFLFFFHTRRFEERKLERAVLGLDQAYIQIQGADPKKKREEKERDGLLNGEGEEKERSRRRRRRG